MLLLLQPYHNLLLISLVFICLVSSAAGYVTFYNKTSDVVEKIKSKDFRNSEWDFFQFKDVPFVRTKVINGTKTCEHAANVTDLGPAISKPGKDKNGKPIIVGAVKVYNVFNKDMGCFSMAQTIDRATESLQQNIKDACEKAGIQPVPEVATMIALVLRVDHINSFTSQGYPIPKHRVTIVRRTYLPKYASQGFFSFLRDSDYPVRVDVYQQQASTNAAKQSAVYVNIRRFFVGIFILLTLYGFWSLYRGIMANTVRLDLRNLIFGLALIATFHCIFATALYIDGFAMYFAMAGRRFYFDVAFYMLFLLWSKVLAQAQGERQNLVILILASVATCAAFAVYIRDIVEAAGKTYAVLFLFYIKGALDSLIAIAFLAYGIRFMLRRKEGMFVSPQIQQALKKLAILALIGAGTYVVQAIHMLLADQESRYASFYITMVVINNWLMNAVRSMALLLVLGVNIPERRGSKATI